jgi:hypothetical protein
LLLVVALLLLLLLLGLVLPCMLHSSQLTGDVEMTSSIRGPGWDVNQRQQLPLPQQQHHKARPAAGGCQLDGRTAAVLQGVPDGVEQYVALAVQQLLPVAAVHEGVPGFEACNPEGCVWCCEGLCQQLWGHTVGMTSVAEGVVSKRQLR